jgi:uncharacterized surface protein with fasciclin (FAS1) repeats
MKLENWIARRFTTAALALLGTVMMMPVPGRATEPLARKAGSATVDIVDTAVAAGSFKTLAAALQAAGLIDALKGDGPFTVFAPTDEAFAKLPAGTVETLLKPENKEKLKAILLYHVVAGRVAARDVMRLNNKKVKTLQGSTVKVRTTGGVRIENARVTQTDIEATNGLIHVIDTVLMPPAPRTSAHSRK